MYDSSWFLRALEQAAEEEEADMPESEPEAAKSPCSHHKVYAAKNEGPYPWICSSCLATGGDEQYPVCDSRLFTELQLKLDPTNIPTDHAKLRACYYCGKHVHGVFSD